MVPRQIDLHVLHVVDNVFQVQIARLPRKFICHCLLLPTTNQLDVFLVVVVGVGVLRFYKVGIAGLGLVGHGEGLTEGGGRLDEILSIW